jgi:hypothetical protein
MMPATGTHSIVSADYSISAGNASQDWDTQFGEAFDEGSDQFNLSALAGPRSISIVCQDRV